jgi:hypothetical protein
VRKNYSHIKKQLIEKYGSQCYLCGIDHPLQIAHVVPISRSETLDIENLRLVCPNCHYLLDTGSFREYEFEKYLFELIKLNKSFSHVTTEKIIGKDSRKRIDIYAMSGLDELYIEVRALSFLNSQRISEIIKQLEIYKKDIGTGKIVFAFPGVLSDDAKDLFIKKHLVVWDIPAISEKFRKEIPKVTHPIFQTLFRSSRYKQLEKELIEKLEATKSGKGEWNIYQKLMNEILGSVFCPPLSNPIYELSDEFKVNRRDFILPNYSDAGFWAYLRHLYNADFIVIDAKNYSKRVQKKDVLQISNYLKSHGAGLFGIIISRNGGDSSCTHTIKEVWAIQKKLIIVLDDEDIKQMLNLKAAGNNPDDVIKQKIEQFRLSL